MRLVQFWLPDQGRRLGRVEDDLVVDLSRVTGLTSMVAAIVRARLQDQTLDDLLQGVAGPVYRLSDLDRPPDPRQPHVLIPIEPPEVWGCGVTYRRSAEFRDEETQASSGRGLYDYVYSAPRPEIFFKATASRCVGPYQPIGVRSDSTFTAPEPELALVLDKTGRILAYTLANDVSAWDIERENPLYLPQSKIFAGCCALGPVLATPTSVPEPLNLALSCRILREGEVLFQGEVNTGRIGRTFAELIDYLKRDNPIPDGTVLCTGTGIVVTREHALQPGDIVEIMVPEIGTLRNPVQRLAGVVDP